MEDRNFICVNCGSERAISPNEKDYNEAYIYCEECHGMMTLVDNEELPISESEAEEDMKTIELYMMLEIQQSLKKMGNDETWLTIEHVGDAVSRTKYREYFFLYGGQVPGQVEIK